MKRDPLLERLNDAKHPRRALARRKEMVRQRQSSMIVAIERSIVEAHNISRRHARGKATNARLQLAAISLIDTLHAVKTELMNERDQTE